MKNQYQGYSIYMVKHSAYKNVHSSNIKQSHFVNSVMTYLTSETVSV